MISAYTQSLVINLNQRYQFDPKTFFTNAIHRHKMILFSQEYIVNLKNKKNALKQQRGPSEMVR